MHSNVMHNTACFHKWVQKTRETADAFVRSLCDLAQHRELGGNKDEQISNRIVIGISDIDVSQQLQLEPDLSPEKVIQIACQSEQIKQQNVSICADCAVDAVREERWQFHAKKSSNDRQW